MRFYHIEEGYIDFLRLYGARVPLNKMGRRPYVGVIITVGEIQYFAPLTSPKAKHLRMKNTKDFRKIGGGAYGAINLNNMIPVPQCALLEIDIQSEPDRQYRNLLQNQQAAIRADESAITEAAEKLHRLIFTERELLSDYERTVQDRCCNLRLLESVFTQYAIN